MKNYDTILADFQPLLIPGEVYEVRIPKYKGKYTCSGYFDNPDKMAEAIQPYDGIAEGIYYTINPCNLDLLSRANNRIVEYAKNATGDDNIARLSRILIDIDVPRPAGFQY